MSGRGVGGDWQAGPSPVIAECFKANLRNTEPNILGRQDLTIECSPVAAFADERRTRVDVFVRADFGIARSLRLLRNATGGRSETELVHVPYVCFTNVDLF